MIKRGTIKTFFFTFAKFTSHCSSLTTILTNPFCKRLIYELHRKTTFFIYVVDFYILLKYGIATQSDFVNEKKGSTNQSRAYPFSFGICKRFFLQWQKYQISFLFVINIFYPTYFIQTFKFAKKLITRIKSVCQFTNQMAFFSECYILCFLYIASMKSKDVE